MAVPAQGQAVEPEPERRNHADLRLRPGGHGAEKSAAPANQQRGGVAHADGIAAALPVPAGGGLERAGAVLHPAPRADPLPAAGPVV